MTVRHRRTTCLLLAAALTCLAPGLDFYGALAATFSEVPGNASVPGAPGGPALGNAPVGGTPAGGLASPGGNLLRHSQTPRFRGHFRALRLSPSLPPERLSPLPPPIDGSGENAERLEAASQETAEFSASLQSAVPPDPQAVSEGGARAFEKAVFGRSQVFVTRPGHEPVAVPLEGLGRFLAADPALKEAVNRSGRVRVVLSGGDPSAVLTKADVARVQESLKGQGVTAKLEVERIAIDRTAGKALPLAPSRKPFDSAQDRQEGGGPLGELAYLARALRASFTVPTWRMVVTGATVKFVIPLGLLKQVGWLKIYAGHPVALAMALGFSLSVNAFHGIFVNTWANFQNIIGKQRGLRYQMLFNLAYGQMINVIFRLITWSAIAGTVPPWHWRFWKDVWIAAVAGSFFGTLGFQGVNTLYNSGRLRQWQRDGILLLRDLAMNLSGFFFGAGSMRAYWTVFIAQQAVDLGIYVLSRMLRRRPVLYVVDDAVASAPEFRSMYPVAPGSVEPESPLKQAWKALAGSPFVRPAVWLARKIREILSRRS